MEKAEKMFRQSIELSSTIVSPYYSLGNLLISKGKKEEGFSFLAKAAGFRDWKRVKEENEFEGYRNRPKLK